MKKCALLILSLLLAFAAEAYDFKKVIGGVTYCFSIEQPPVAKGKGSVYLSSVQIPSPNGKQTALNLTIPQEVVYDGERYEVTAIEPRAFAECEPLTRVVIPRTVSNIGYSAFEGCASLRTVVVDCDSLIVSSSSFSGCTALDSLVIGPSARYLSPLAFSWTSNLSEIVFLAEHPSSMQSLFYASQSPARITIGENVAVVPQFICFNFTGLRAVEFAGDKPHLSIIEQFAFANCPSLRQVAMPASLGVVKESAFAYCTLQSLTFLSEYPPVLDNAPFYGVETSLPVTIPCGSRQNYANSAVGRLFTNLIYPRGCAADAFTPEVVYIHDTVYVHDTIYLPESLFREHLLSAVSETDTSMYANIETDTEDVVGDAEPQDWIFIDGRVVRITKALKLRGTRLRLFDERGDMVAEDRIPGSYSSDNYYLKLPSRKRYFLVIGTLDAISVDVQKQKIGM